MEMTLHIGKAIEAAGHMLFVPVFEGDQEKYKTLKEIDRLFDGEVIKEMRRSDFTGKEGTEFSLPMLGKLSVSRAVFIGIGPKKKYHLDHIRKFGARVYKSAKALKATQAAVQFEDLPNKAYQSKEVVGAFTEGALLAGYSFLHYQSEKKKKKREVEAVKLFTDDKRTLGALERGLQEAKGLAKGVDLARELVNTPPSDMHPEAMLRAAEALAQENKQIRIKVFDQRRMERMGMHAALAVAKGSECPPYGVHLTYVPKKKAKKRIVLVGKAVTFDSGGLSLKPSDGMKTMKLDMGGAASVLGLFKTLEAIEPAVEIHGIFLAVENMPSGKAYRPGDVVRAMNGKTIEVLNTDAEGRVTLADALSYASKLKPDAIVDLATLTGSCIHALGEDMAAILTQDDKLAEKLLNAAERSGEALWRLPMFAAYRKDMKSKIADVRNVGGRGAGTITAALFLEHFVDAPSWAHLDIAGPVYTEKESRPDMPFGATGYGVRLLARYLQAI